MTAFRPSRAQRAGMVSAVMAAFAAIVVLTFLHFTQYPATAYATSSGPGQADITLQTVGAIGTEPHPPWVSYLVQRPGGEWVHTTVLKVPAHSTIHVTVYQYDTGSDLRNPLMNQVQGVNDATVNGRPYSTWTNVIGHTFTIPQLGISVPLPGVPDNAKNQCTTSAPCSPKFNHMKVEFTFHTGAAGTYTWQCFVPCGVGYIAGFGGPMSTVGYMNGILQVVA